MSKYDFISLRPSASPPKTRHFYIPPHLVRSTSVADSVSSEDPLVTLPTSRYASPTRAGPSKPRLAVVLNASPQRQRPQPINVNDEGGENVVTSDLSRSKHESRPPVASVTGPRPVEKATKPSGRPRGRPKGSGLGSHAHKTLGTTAAGSREARQIKVRPSMNGFGKRRGRPPKVPSPPPRAIYESLRPSFLVFLCEWAGCKAELQNLTTLRRHILIVHGDSPHCSWGSCISSSTQFDTDEAFAAHVEDAHLVPFAWHVGDGHRNAEPVRTKEEEEEMPDFLKDEKGLQVTPWVRDQEVEDLQTWRSNRRKLKELLRRRDENLPEGDSEEFGDEYMS